jgi:hypothetical protein
MERERGAARLKDQSPGQLGGYKPCKEFPAVRRSLFGQRERSNSLRDGDKPGIFFLEVLGDQLDRFLFQDGRKALQLGKEGQVGQDLQRAPYWRAAVRRKVNATIKINTV